LKNVTLFATSVLVIISIHGCAIQKELVQQAGVVLMELFKLSYEYGLFEIPELDAQQGMNVHKKDVLHGDIRVRNPLAGITRHALIFQTVDVTDG